MHGSINKLKDTALPAAVVAIITGLILLIAMIGAYPLCTGYGDEEEGANKDAAPVDQHKTAEQSEVDKKTNE